MQKSKVFLFIAALFISVLQCLYAQTQKAVTGKVTDNFGEPLTGVNVIIQGTTGGTATDLDGKYTITVSPDAVLQFSYIGMKDAIVPVNGQSLINVAMEPDVESLGESVVTAMGIKRLSETLTYSAETVGGKDLNEVKSINMINALQGKSAGVVITPNSTGAGGASKILLRGNKSIAGSNQPLIVVDGMPVMNSITTDQATWAYGGSRDGGDVMSTINPDDITQITVLKGASAAALYGAIAANGAILITTKSGQSGKVSVNVSSNTTAESAMSLPKFQNKYGITPGDVTSWGSKLAKEAPNYAKEFYRTGFTTNNTVSFSGGNENFQSYFSYGNIYSKGIVPTNYYRSHNLTAKVGFTILEKVKADFTANYTQQYTHNQPFSGFLSNQFTGSYLFPRGEDWNYYKKNFEQYDANRGTMIHNWPSIDLEQFANPYWLLNRQVNEDTRTNYKLSGGLTYDIIDGLKLQGRMRYEEGQDRYKRLDPASGYANRNQYGGFSDGRHFSRQLYADLLLSYNKQFTEKFSLDATVGSSTTRTKTDYLPFSGGNSAFVKPGDGNTYYPNIFNPDNYYTNGSRDYASTEKRLNAVFATAQLGFFNSIFLDLTARNDWASTLAFTDGVSFFYPSAGLSVLVNRLANLGENVDLLKLRTSYSIVGNDIPIYITNLRYTIGDLGSITAPSNAPFRTLQPEKTKSFEAGVDGTFLQNRLNLSFTYYKTNTTNQLLTVEAPYETGVGNRYVNAGNIQNQGLEATIGWYQFFGDNFSWHTSLNMAYNKNKVVELVEGLEDGMTLSSGEGWAVRLLKGGEYGDIYARGMNDEATAAGTPTLGSNNAIDWEKQGNLNSPVTAGWTNTFRFGNFTVNMLIDGRFGGVVLSQAQAVLDRWGVSKTTGDARDNGGVVYNGKTFDARTWYEATAPQNWNTNYFTANYIYKATNIRMRELSVGYTFHNVLGLGNSLTASLIGRNLFFFYKDAPMDPDTSIGTGNGLQGIDMFNLPTSRSVGLNLKYNF